MADETAREFSVEGDLEEVQAWFDERRLSDGLPIVPPTEERVARMLAAVDLARDVSLGAIPPSRGEATIEKLAINAVMAGCKPAYFPVILAAVRAMMAEQFNLFAVQVTTHPAAPLLVVHGPVAKEIGMHGGAGVWGPGFPANATIGRAIRLILLNVGAAFPGEGDRSTQGSSAKYSFCITENAAESPWPEFHVTRGLRAEESAVTLYAGEGPNSINDAVSVEAHKYLSIVADAMCRHGINSWFLGPNEYAVILPPERAQLIANQGWTREDVQHFLFHRATRPAGELKTIGMYTMRDWPVWMDALAERPEAPMPVVRKVEDIHVLVAGGPGKHTSILPSFGISHAVTIPVRPRG